MARPRTPSLKAEVTGRAKHDPQRFENRKEPDAKPLGKPSPFLDKHGQKAWEAFKVECFWLNESHRAFLEVACSIRGRLLAGEDVGVQALNLLRQCLGQMGATPADASKVSVSKSEEEDPDSRFYQ